MIKVVPPQTLDTLTIRFFRYGDKWGCSAGDGPDFLGNVAGFGATPKLAMLCLCDSISYQQDDGVPTDNNQLILR